MHMRPFSYLLLTLAVALSLSTAVSASAPSEYDVKAAFIYNFMKFVEWPKDSFGDDTSGFIVGIIGTTQFGECVSDLVANKTVSGRKITVRENVAQDDMTSCHLVFFEQSEDSRTKELLATLKGTAVLTVGESEIFAQEGGIIRFVIHENKVRFTVSLPPAEEAGLKLSAKLLKVALEVKK